MNKDILNTGVQNFIYNNVNTDIVSLLLKKPIFDTISSKELVQQIESKKKCKKKLPTWFNQSGIYYPKKINIEQTSSETTALYKSSLVSKKTLVDVTGGLGVDSYFFGQQVDTIFHCEIDADLAELASHNFNVLGVKNVQTIVGDGIKFLEDSDEHFDWLFIDPSRRNDRKGKVFHLSDCVPDISKHFDLFFSKADNILIKTAPFLDIFVGTKQLSHSKEIHIVAVNGEVKELLWVLQKDYIGAVQVKTINLTKDGSQTFDFLFQEEKDTNSSFSLPMNYLYEPNAAIMKSGAFKTVGNRFSLAKFHKHTHLYTSKELIEFPGRRFVIKEYLPYNKKTGLFLRGLKANISVKNFPKTVAEIKNDYRITDGGSVYLFFVKDLNDKLIVLQCEKVT